MGGKGRSLLWLTSSLHKSPARGAEFLAMRPNHTSSNPNQLLNFLLVDTRRLLGHVGSTAAAVSKEES